MIGVWMRSHISFFSFPHLFYLKMTVFWVRSNASSFSTAPLMLSFIKLQTFLETSTLLQGLILTSRKSCILFLMTEKVIML